MNVKTLFSLILNKPEVPTDLCACTTLSSRIFFFYYFCSKNDIYLTLSSYFPFFVASYLRQFNAFLSYSAFFFLSPLILFVLFFKNFFSTSVLHSLSISFMTSFLFHSVLFTQLKNSVFINRLVIFFLTLFLSHYFLNYVCSCVYFCSCAPICVRFLFFIS